MRGNNAPRLEWRVWIFGDIQRRRLYVDGRETPYFIDRALAAHLRTYGEQYGLYGAGMSATGTAAVLGFGPRLEPLRHRAEQRALSAL